ncbi:MAG: SdrD B-like domain-containing protein [Acidimicrobiia bacterium]
MHRIVRYISILAAAAIALTGLLVNAAPAAADSPEIQLEQTIVSGAPPVETTSATVPSGEEFSILLKYRCASTAPCLGSVVTMVMPTDLELRNVYVPTDVASWNQTGGSYYPVGAAHQHFGGQTLTFTMLGTLPGGSTGQIQVKAAFPDWWTPSGTTLTSTSTFTATNAAQVSSNAVTLTSSASTAVSMSKTLNAGGAVDDYSRYDISLCVNWGSNTGNLGLVDQVITDPLPAGAEFYWASEGGSETSPGVVTWNISDTSWWGCRNVQVWVKYPAADASNVVGALKTNTATWSGRRFGEPTAGPLGDATTSHNLQAPSTNPFPQKYVSTPRYNGAEPVPYEAWYNDSVNYWVYGYNGGNSTSTTLTMSDAIPAELKVTSVSAYSSQFGSGSVWVRSLNDPTWRKMVDITPANSTSADPYSATWPSGGAGLASSDWLTDIEWRHDLLFPNEQTWGSFNAVVKNPDRNGAAVDPGHIVTNTVTQTAQSITGIDSTSNSSVQFAVRKTTPPTYLYVNKWANGNVDPVTRDLTYTLQASTSQGSVNDPVMYDLLPSGMTVNGWSWDFAGDPAPIVTQTADFNGTGRTLVRITWPAGTVLAPNNAFSIQLNLHVANTVWGTVENGLSVTNTDPSTPFQCNWPVADAQDLDGDGNTTEVMCFGSSTINIIGVASARVDKIAKGIFDDGFVAGPGLAASDAGDPVSISIPITNTSTVPLDQVTVIDVLPATDDTNVMNATPRNVGSFVPELSSLPVGPAGAVVSYSTVSNPCRAELGYSPAGCNAPNWSTTPPSPLGSTTAIKVDWPSGNLNPGVTWSVDFEMTVPVGTAPGSRAWNSAAFRGRRIDLASQLIPSESRAVGIRVPTGNASLGDLVYNDANGDGVRDPGEVGIANVAVSLWAPGADLTLGTADDELISNQITGADGSYAFHVLDAGNYRVTVDAATLGGIDVPTADRDMSLDGSTDISITGTMTVSDADFGFSSRKLGNFLWEDTNANGVQDPSEPGIDGVPVFILRNGSVIQLRNTGDDPSTTSIEHGWYSFDRLAPDTQYQIGTAAPLGYAITYANIGSDDAVDSDVDPANNLSPQTYTFTGSTAVIENADIGLVPSSSLGSVSGFFWDDTNSDGLQTPGEAGLPNEWVALRGRGFDGQWWTSDDTYSGKQVGSDGLYSFPTVLPGHYHLEAAVGWPRVRTLQDVGADDSIDSDISVSNGWSSDFDISAGSNQDMDIGATSPAILSGWSFFDANNNDVRDAAEGPLQGTYANVYNVGADGTYGTADDQYAAGISLSNATRGTASLSPGTYVACVSGTIFSPSLKRLVAGNQGTDDAIDSDPNQSTNCTDPFVALGGATQTFDAGYSGGNAAVTGTVWEDMNSNGIQDIGELGVQNRSVSLYDAGPDGQRWTSDDSWAGNINTDLNGHYTFSELFDSNYYISFQWPDTGFAWTLQDQGTDDAIDSDVSPQSSWTDVRSATAANSAVFDAGIRAIELIGDRAWIDTNGNGIQDMGENGLPYIPIMLHGLGPDGVEGTSDDANITTWTNWDGSYSLTGMTAGETYWFSFPAVVSSNGSYYGPTLFNQGGDLSLDSDIDPATLRSPLFILNAGAHITDLDFGFAPGDNTLKGHIWEDTDSNGIQDPGEPGIQKYNVELMSPGPDAIVGTYDDIYYASTGTDQFGDYEFAGLPAATYFIRPSAPDAFHTWTGFNVGSDDGIDSDVSPARGSSDAVTLSGSSVAAIDGGLAPKRLVRSHVWRDDNGNGIQDKGEPPIQNVTATLRSLGPDHLPFTGDETSENASTDGNGDIAFSNAQTGSEYWIEFPTIASDGSAFYSLTSLDQGTDDSIDSDAAPADGITGTFTHTGSSDSEMDAGYVPGTASVGDFVWNDQNRNGIQNDGEPGIGNTEVRLIALGPDGTLNTSDDISIWTTSASDGSYSFQAVPAGTFVLRFSPATNDNLSPKHVGSDTTLDSDPDPSSQVTDVFTVSTGEVIQSMDAGVMVRPSITGTVWYDQNGDGINSNESPIQNVSLRLFAPGPDGAFGTADDQHYSGASTDGSGHYSISGVPAGTYRIRTNPVFAGYGDIGSGWNWNMYSLTTRDAGSDDTIDSDLSQTTGWSQTLTVTSSGAVVDFGGVTGSSTIHGTTWIDSNADGIRDMGESAPPWASMQLSEAGPDGIFDTQDDSSNSIYTSTDGSGNYSFGPLPSGVYRIQTYSNGPTTRPNVASDDTVDSDFTMFHGYQYSDPISLGVGVDLGNIDAGFISGAGIRGRAWVDSNSDGIELSETGVRYVAVSVHGPGWDGILGNSDDVEKLNYTDWYGDYSIDGLIPGDYSVSTGPVVIPNWTSPGHAYGLTAQDQGSDDSIDSDALPSTGAAPVTLSLGDSVKNVNFGLIEGTGTISGEVWQDDFDGIRESGEPALDKVRVALATAGPNGIWDDNDDGVWEQTTDSAGHYSFGALPQGTYRVRFDQGMNPGLYLTTQHVGNDTTIDSDPTASSFKNWGYTDDVVVTPGGAIDHIDAGYYPAGNMGGLVWEDHNHNGIREAGDDGISGVVVHLRLPGTDGIFDTADDDYGDLVTGGDGRWDLGPFPAIPLRVTVELAGTSWSVVAQDQGSDDTIDSDVDQSTRMFIAHAGMSDTSVDAGLFNGVILPTDTTRIDGHVFVDVNNNGAFDAGEPQVSGVMFGASSIGSLSALANSPTPSNQNGAFVFDGLAAGKYSVAVLSGVPAGLHLVADSDGGSDGVAQTTTAVGAPGSVWFAYRGLGSIDTTVWNDLNGDGVRNADEPGIANAAVTITGPNGTVIHATTDASGRLVVDGLPYGEYTITVAGQGNQTADPDGVIDSATTITISTPEPMMTVFGYAVSTSSTPPVTAPPATSSSTSSAAPPATTSTPGSGTHRSRSPKGALPFTGTNAMALAALALGLVFGGFMILGRRRRTAAS